MSDRRAMGALEYEVLECLWGADRPLTPGDVLEQFHGELAYTTVMTILKRLWEKGLVDRVRQGRAFAYSTKVSEAELMASRMQNTPRAAHDAKATLARFVHRLSKREAAALRAALEGEGN
jgi:predicted transcriptional regulator